MLTTEYKEEEVMELFKEDGRKEGVEKTIIISLKQIMKNLHLTIEQAMDALEIPFAERQKYSSAVKG